MKNKTIFALIVLLACGTAIFAQKKKPKLHQGKVCGDPTVKCQGSENFQPNDLPFDQGKGFAFFESVPFYGIVLRSVKLPDWGDCQNPKFAESERLPIQELFPRNKVFALNCVDSGSPYYTGVKDQTAFIAVYAGRTLAEANTFLKTVNGMGKFPGVKVRKMQIGINGT